MMRIILLALFLTACGPDDSAPPPAPTPTPTPPICDPDHYVEPCRGILDHYDGVPQ